MPKDILKVMIGYDPNEVVAYHVLAHSIISRSSAPVSIIPVKLEHLEGHKKDPKGSTEFSLTRFLTPMLAGYTGQALFLDCDMLVRCDIKELFDQCGHNKDVYVVKHDYTPKNETKFLDNEQHVYPRKNWSSMMLFNCAACKRLTNSFVADATPSVLHQFKWCQDERIGELGAEWNHLVGEGERNPEAKIIHFTNGIPPFKGMGRQEFAQEWRAELKEMNYAAS
jgi:hypothetical protein